jgi:glycosyltransferase involved in cell wall biosynthesis
MEPSNRVPKIALFWESYGPYHYARLNAVRKLLGDDRVIGIEISPLTTTYAWSTRASARASIISLLSDRPAEQVAARVVYNRLRQVLDSHKVETVFIPSYWPLSSFVALLAAKRLGLRTVMMNDSHMLTGQNSCISRWVKSLLVSKFNAAFVAGTVHRRFFRQLGMPNEKIVEGYDTVDNAYFAAKSAEVRANPNPWRQLFALPDHYILSLGRLVKKKNLELVIEAFAVARADGKLAGQHLVFVGDGPEKEKLVGLCQRRNLRVIDHGKVRSPTEQLSSSIAAQAVVHFYAFAQIDYTPTFYALASCFVLASHADEWGLVVNEAMASGCPVVVSRNVGCASDLVIPGQTGYRFGPKNLDELVFRLDTICKDEVGARRLGFGAQEHIKNWSNERFAANARDAAILAADMAGLPVAGEPAREAYVTIFQTCFPDYREVLFSQLDREFEGCFRLVCGRTYFTTGISMCKGYNEWQDFVDNRFLWFRNLLWQRGAVRHAGTSDIVVLELNPRILTNWLILINRRLIGAPTLLWGHIWARKGRSAITNGIRLAMMSLASGIISYTRTQAEELKPFLKGKSISVAPNSLVSRSQCRPRSHGLGSAMNIVYSGRLIPEKKPALLVEGFLLAARALPLGVSLIVIGDGPEAASLRTRAIGSIHSSRIKFFGHIYDEKTLEEVYGGCFCSVSPGYVGLNVVQSFAYGIPMVIGDQERHSPEIEVCQDQFNSIRFRSNDPESLASALRSMWEHRAEWFEKRFDIAGYIEQNYSAECMAEGFIDATSRALNR